jgi:DNA helicase-2/ATP-dependent DNA helicase PcrA
LAPRSAVEPGCGDLGNASPLLVIAGAGSGKTNTLAHPVAHLIASGADSRRIMLLTFSRRAAAEMQRRVERITKQALGAKAGAMADALTWSGTSHAIGARLLREYAGDIGLDPAFTIHDREDSADLMNLVRHDLGFSQTEKRFPMTGTAIYSRAVNAEAPLSEVLGNSCPWCAEWEAELRRLFGAYVEAKQKRNVLDYAQRSAPRLSINAGHSNRDFQNWAVSGLVEHGQSQAWGVAAQGDPSPPNIATRKMSAKPGRDVD